MTEFREGAVRIVRETGKPIAQVARELGLNEGTLGRWVNLDRRAREGEGPLSENERDELNRLRKEMPSWRWSVMCSSARLPSHDAAVSLAVLIAAQRAEHGIPAAVSCRALGVSQAWFHKWRKGDRSPRRKRRMALAATIAYLRQDGGMNRIEAASPPLFWWRSG
ncbi:transposase [Nocardia sp. NPDC004278]